MAEKPFYRVMRETSPGSGRMKRASGDYVQRASAFKRAEKVAASWPDYAVTVWEYAGPGASVVHSVQRAKTSST